MQNGVIDLSPTPLAPRTTPCLQLRGASVGGGAASPFVLQLTAGDAKSRGGRLVARAIAISVALHALAAIALFWTPAPNEAGAGGEIEAAGIELVNGTAVESVANTPGTQTADSEQVSTNAGEENKDIQPPVATTDTSLQDKTDPPALEAKALDGDMAAAPEPQPEVKPEDVAAKTEEGQGKDVSRNAAQEAIINGGATSRGVAEIAVVSEAVAAASEGEMSRYAADVHAALMRQRPRHAGSGRVKIEFTLTPAGHTRDAVVITSSGDIALDAIAVNAVRNAHFPAPPHRATEAQLRYTTVIKFR